MHDWGLQVVREATCQPHAGLVTHAIFLATHATRCGGRGLQGCTVDGRDILQHEKNMRELQQVRGGGGIGCGVVGWEREGWTPSRSEVVWCGVV